LEDSEFTSRPKVQLSLLGFLLFVSIYRSHYEDHTSAQVTIASFHYLQIIIHQSAKHSMF